MRRLFEEFRKNQEKHLKQFQNSIGNLFSLNVMFFSSKWLYFSARAVSSLSRILAM